MGTLPEYGLGASALRAWQARREAEGLEHTAVWISKQLEVKPSSVHEWLTAGWLEGGAVPKSFHRKALAALVGDDVRGLEGLFDADDARRERWKRAGRPSPRAAAFAPFAQEAIHGPAAS